MAAPTEIFSHILSILQTYWIGLICVISQLLWGHKKLEDFQQHNGRVAIVTGGDGDIGMETVRVLCQHGMHVIIGVKNEDSIPSVEAAIKALCPFAKLECLPLDLGSFNSIQQFVKSFRESDLPLHVLVNNAGIMHAPFTRTTDGFESHLGINYMGHFVLTRLLLDNLKRSGTMGQYSRIVSVSSAVHAMGKISGVQDLNSNGFYCPYASYGQSKMALVLGTYGLQARLKDAEMPVTVNCLHPGVVDTNLYRHLPHVLQPLKNLFAWLGLMWTPRQGSSTSIFLSLSQEVEGTGGQYFDNCQAVPSSHSSYDTQLQEELWKWSCDVTQLPYDVKEKVTVNYS